MRPLLLALCPWLVVAGEVFGCPEGTHHLELDAGGWNALSRIAQWVGVQTGQAVDIPELCLAASGHLPVLIGDSEGMSGPLGTVAVYSRAERTILLTEVPDLEDPVSQSILVHEFVHHAQTLAGRRFSCFAEAEAEAYRVQELWLETSGQTLETAFGINALARLILTNCTM